MKSKLSIFFSLIFILFGSIVFFSNCNQDKKDEKYNSEPETSKEILNLMEAAYLWYEYIPGSFNIQNYKNAKTTFNALLYKPRDKWSFISTRTAWEQTKEGEDQSYGINFKYDANYNVRVTFVYDNSPMAKAGIKRSYIMQKVNNKDVDELINEGSFTNELGKGENKFQFRTPAGDTNTYQIQRQSFQMNAILYNEIKQVAGKKVGYVVLNTFLPFAESEIDTIFTKFAQESIDELILDLRYNGGGSSYLSQNLASLIVPSSHYGDAYVKYSYNDRVAEQADTTFTFIDPLQDTSLAGKPLDLSRLFVISTPMTASASEVLINGLEPYMDVIHIGDYTNGKPVGMQQFNIGNYAAVPVLFKMANANGEAEYYNGLEPDAFVMDDVSHYFGDKHEDCYEEALYYIRNNEFSGEAAKTLKRYPSRQKYFIPKGRRAFIGCY